MLEFNKFLEVFFTSQYFIVLIVILVVILLVLITYLIKLQYSYKTEEATLKSSLDIKEEINAGGPVLNLESLNNTQADIVLNLNAAESILKNPIELYEEDEEECAIISTKDLEKIEKERDEVYGKENNAKLIEEYEENQEKKAIISYDELLRNASSLELNYIEKPKEEENAPIIKQVEIKDQVLKSVSYKAEEEYLEILKEFRANLISNG